MTYELLCLFQLAKLMQDDGPNPRASWSTFLNSVCHEVPSSKFRDFQVQSFQLAMRFLPQRPVTDPTPVPPPMSETQRLATHNLPPQVPQQQQQYAPAATATVTGPLWTAPLQQQGIAMQPPPLQQQGMTLQQPPLQQQAITLQQYTAPSQAPATSTGYITVSI